MRRSMPHPPTWRHTWPPCGLGTGDTALVQLPNVAEFYLRASTQTGRGTSVNALPSQRAAGVEGLCTRQPADATRQHELFRRRCFVDELATPR
ncbi:hypothetical protein DSL92_07675 [Billgrantia gudaonensis]|uniref:Uncharacterized protein n=1 Tax=Billgrantia gudaonensis TaxID=376427 RepID=A0A432JGL1_9GAMM|nr:hypothetical protein DSL92_07675 [Halomonas gudaonensis]